MIHEDRQMAPVGQLLARVHRRAAPVLGEMCLALASRRVSVSAIEAWVRELRAAADDLEDGLNSDQ